MPFTKQEIEILWENINKIEYVDLALICIYKGLRPSELLDIKTADVNIEKGYMRGGLKTNAGKNRIIPIHHKILPYVKKWYNENRKYLIHNPSGNKMLYGYYHDLWTDVMEKMAFNHSPYATRHTFATLMDNAGANKLAIKRIMGHASKDVTDKVYTHKDIDELTKAIELLE